MKKKYYLLVFAFIFIKSNLLYSQTNCSTALPITINGACQSGSVNDNSADLPALTGCTATFNRERWYTFTVVGGSQTITITGTSTSTNRNLYLQLISLTGTCASGTLTQIACANAINTNSAQTETITITLTNGVYFIKVLNV
ncbi:MAG TPA: pre-peptidase C-terminal domain-containing protein, partial [Flavobacterium sp.]|nr:pre-peptidase C-terminal domain-containing protein [Flavobacterium sp.]